MTAVDELLLADEAEDAGDWAEAAWRRLRAGSLYPGFIWRVPGGVRVQAGQSHLWVDGPVGYPGAEFRRIAGQEFWEKYDPARVVGWLHFGPPPPWVRAAVEGAAALATARVLASVGADRPVP